MKYVIQEHASYSGITGEKQYSAYEVMGDGTTLSYVAGTCSSTAQSCEDRLRAIVSPEIKTVKELELP